MACCGGGNSSTVGRVTTVTPGNPQPATAGAVLPGKFCWKCFTFWGLIIVAILITWSLAKGKK